MNHCLKSLQIRSYFWSVFLCIGTEYREFYSVSRIFSVFNPNTGKYGPEITSYLDTFHAVEICVSRFSDGEDGNLICEGGCCFGGAVGSIL